MLLKDKLIWIRKTTGKTQAKMAKAAGVSLRTWKNYEQGKYDIPIFRLTCVAIYCYIDVASILADYMPKPKEIEPQEDEEQSDSKKGIKNDETDDE